MRHWPRGQVRRIFTYRRWSYFLRSQVETYLRLVARPNGLSYAQLLVLVYSSHVSFDFKGAALRQGAPLFRSGLPPGLVLPRAPDAIPLAQNAITPCSDPPALPGGKRELELIQPYMTQKPMLRGEVEARALHV